MPDIAGGTDRSSATNEVLSILPSTLPCTLAAPSAPSLLPVTSPSGEIVIVTEPGPAAILPLSAARAVSLTPSGMSSRPFFASYLPSHEPARHPMLGPASAPASAAPLAEPDAEGAAFAARDAVSAVSGGSRRGPGPSSHAGRAAANAANQTTARIEEAVTGRQCCGMRGRPQARAALSSRPDRRCFARRSREIIFSSNEIFVL